jgi:hypothetical protein
MLGHWDEKQFTDAFLERARENAKVMNVNWTSEMEGALKAAAPGRWLDVSAVVSEAEAASKAGASKRPR